MWPLCCREPDALMSVATSPVHSQDPSGHAADGVEKLRPIYLAATAVPVSPAAPTNGGSR